MVTNNLAEALRQLFELTGDRAILYEAYRAHRQAVGLARSIVGADLALILCESGKTVRTWLATQRGTREAIKLQQEALDITNPESIEWPFRLVELAWSWRALSSVLRGKASLAAADRAVVLFRQALAAIPESTPKREKALRGQAEAIEQRWRQTKNPDDLQAALTGYSAAMASTVMGSPIETYAAAHAAGRFAAEAGNFETALTYLEQGLGALERLLASQGTVEDKGLILSQAYGLIQDTYAAYYRTGQHEKATATLH
jgi:tetratricopeptide (TPR) repeat protein